MKNIKDIKVDVPDGSSGDWRVERFTVSKKEADFHNLRASFSFGGGGRTIRHGTYTRLLRGNGDPRQFGGSTIVMSDTPSEIDDHRYFVNRAEGHVLINGLGLGWIVEALLRKKEVKTITVIEKSHDVINLVAKHYENKCTKNKKLWIIQADAFDYQPPKGKKYNAVWHDIWDNICAENLDDMHKLHRKYGRRCDWQGSWCRDLCERYA